MQVGGPDLMKDLLFHLLVGEQFQEAHRHEFLKPDTKYEPLPEDTGAFNLLTWMGKTDWDIDWSKLDCPVLLIQGQQDRIFYDPPIVAELTAKLPNAISVNVPEAGHMLPMEMPDAFPGRRQRLSGVSGGGAMPPRLPSYPTKAGSPRQTPSSAAQTLSGSGPACSAASACSRWSSSAMPTTMVESAWQPNPKRSAAWAGVPNRSSSTRQTARCPGRLRGLAGIGGDRHFPPVPRGRGEVPCRENADAHHAHVLRRAGRPAARRNRWCSRPPGRPRPRSG